MRVIEAKSNIKIDPGTVIFQTGIVVLLGSIIAGFIWYEISKRLDLSIGASVFFCIYFSVRYRSFTKGFYLYEQNGIIHWHVSAGPEQSVHIAEIVSIDRLGKTKLANGSHVQLPKPYGTWIPFYFYLYQNYEHLFESEPRVYKGRAV